MTNKFLHTASIFKISSNSEFKELAMEVFRFQYDNNKVYKTFCDLLKTDVNKIKNIKDIPFLPISFFKTHKVYCGDEQADIKFNSSGTTGMVTSTHFVKDISIYEQSFKQTFEIFYGNIKDYIVLGLLPSYLEREGSSLIYMVDSFIKQSNHKNSGFFLNEFDKIERIIAKNEKNILLIGVSYALLDFLEQNHPNIANCIVMETGGMKGKRKEIPKLQLHQILKEGFNVNSIHSEYGMTELLSQAYALKDGKFVTPPWMRVLSRDINDPFTYTPKGKTGGLNIIDLANVYSCAFIATQDLGKVYDDYFEVLGRFDNSDIRGCNLLVQ